MQAAALSAKLHYTGTGYGHVQRHQRTSSQQLFYNLLYTKFATSQCQSPKSRHVKMLACGKFLSVGGVVQHVCSRCPCSGVWHYRRKRCDYIAACIGAGQLPAKQANCTQKLVNAFMQATAQRHNVRRTHAAVVLASSEL